MPQSSPSPAKGGVLRQVWRLACGWYRAEPWMAWGLTIGALALTLVQIAIALRFSLWHRTAFDALERRDSEVLFGQVGVFVVLILASMAVSVSRLYARQELALRWRSWLVLRLQEAMLRRGRHYRMEMGAGGADNPDQRIGENTRWATAMAVDLALGLLHSVVLIVSFAGLLWSLSGNVSLAGFELPGVMVGVAALYAAAGAMLAWRIGRPMPSIHYDRNAAEAAHRFALVRLRENSEAIALVRGERDEEQGLRVAYGRVETAMRRLLRAERHLMFQGAVYMEVAAVLPLLLNAPRFLTGAITLGMLMQLSQAFVEVVRGLSWFSESWPKLADWRTHMDRVVELESVCEAADAPSHRPAIALAALPPCGTLTLRNLDVATACGTPLVLGAQAELHLGERVLITGESGSGKSTLFRAIAGIWPWGGGQICVPDRKATMFMPQRPYLPLGTLREALCYPAAPADFPGPEAEEALGLARLGRFIGRLDETARWDRVLSLGEQQRLAFARLLLHRPRWIFMDEATSALDEEAQEAMLRLVAERLPGAGVLSIGHRPGLARYHDRVLRLVRGPEGARLEEVWPEEARIMPDTAPRASAPRGVGFGLQPGRTSLNSHRLVPTLH